MTRRDAIGPRNRKQMEGLFLQSGSKPGWPKDVQGRRPRTSRLVGKLPLRWIKSLRTFPPLNPADMNHHAKISDTSFEGPPPLVYLHILFCTLRACYKKPRPRLPSLNETWSTNRYLLKQTSSPPYYCFNPLPKLRLTPDDWSWSFPFKSPWRSHLQLHTAVLVIRCHCITADRWYILCMPSPSIFSAYTPLFTHLKSHLAQTSGTVRHFFSNFTLAVQFEI